MFNFWKASPSDNQDASGATLNTAEGQPTATVSDPEAKPDGDTSTLQPKEEITTVGKVLDTAGNPLPLVEGSQSVMAFPRPSTSTDIYVSEVQMVPNSISGVDITGAALLSADSTQPARRRRISFRSFGFFYGRNRPAPSAIAQADSEETVAAEVPLREKIKSKRDARKVEKAALVLQSFLLGHTPAFPSLLPLSATSAQGSSNGKPTKGKAKAKAHAIPATKPPSPSKLSKANNQLLSPDQANKVIAKLRKLPVPNGPELPGIEYAGEHVVSRAEGPIHAVCLDCTEEEADMYHFSLLTTGAEMSSHGNQDNEPGVMVLGDTPSIASANLSSLVPVLRSLHIITLVSSPDLGFGQPPDSPGPLAGSVPSARAVSDGMAEITGQLLALGFATSKAVFPDHAGVYPPTDRMSVLTCETFSHSLKVQFSIVTDWWGMEVCLPPPTLLYLAVSGTVLLHLLHLIYNDSKNVKSIQNSALNLLTAVSLFSNGIREILPFVYVCILQSIIQSDNHIVVVTFLSSLTFSGVPYKAKTKGRGWSVRLLGSVLLH